MLITRCSLVVVAVVVVVLGVVETTVAVLLADIESQPEQPVTKIQKSKLQWCPVLTGRSSVDGVVSFACLF